DGKGRCFGMTLASLRLAAGDRKLSDFAPAGALAPFDLTGPNGPTGDLDHYIHLMFVEQNSLEGLLARAPAQRTPMTADALRAAVESTLRTNRGALLSLHQGDSGHSVIAYDIENDSNGGYFLDVYDPNRPFLASENSDADQHKQREQDSRIAVDPAGGG